MKQNDTLMLMYLAAWFKSGGREEGGAGHPTRMGGGREGDAGREGRPGWEAIPWGKKPLPS